MPVAARGSREAAAIGERRSVSATCRAVCRRVRRLNHLYAARAFRWRMLRRVVDQLQYGTAHLPADRSSLECFVCGPVPMMDAVERDLAVIGVPRAHIHTERFQVV